MSTHCCDMMRENVEKACPDHEDKYDCPDALIDYWENDPAYGIIVHDGGHSMITINFCPWCGTKLDTE